MENETINKSELENIEKEIMQKEILKQKQYKNDIEKEIRDKLQQEQKLKELEEKNKRLEEMFKESLQKTETEKKQREEELLKLKEEIAKPKGYVKSENPFQGGNNEKAFDINSLTQEQIREIDENSKKAFMAQLGILPNEW